MLKSAAECTKCEAKDEVEKLKCQLYKQEKAASDDNRTMDQLKGKLVPVRIVEALPYSLVGEMEGDRFVGGRYEDDGSSVLIG